MGLSTSQVTPTSQQLSHMDETIHAKQRSVREHLQIKIN